LNIGLEAAKNRIRPILMTSLAMIAGMIPMAIGFGDGGDQTSPLGVAVIGGLTFSMFTTLLVLPIIYNGAKGNKPFASASLDPYDEGSKNFGH
jgi:multidrug efflux pump subunit AcrB